MWAAVRLWRFAATEHEDPKTHLRERSLSLENLRFAFDHPALLGIRDAEQAFADVQWCAAVLRGEADDAPDDDESAA